jgi:phosphopantothenoylcysteine synthetase/decarboxylase
MRSLRPTLTYETTSVMPEDSGQERVLYVISCGSPAARLVPNLVGEAQSAGWHVCVIASPSGRKFLNISLLEDLTGHPVRSDYKHPDEPDILPRADAVVAFPATFNTVNKWALGISDTLAVGLLCEYTGLRMPVIAVPCVGTDSGLDAHPAFQRSLGELRAHGVHVIYDPETYSPEDEGLPALVARRLAQVTARQ